MPLLRGGICFGAKTDTVTCNTVDLQEVIVAADRAVGIPNTKIREVRLIRQHQIQTENVQNTADLLMNLGGITVQKSQQGGGSPIIRGFEASRILLLIDYIRLNNLIYRTGHLQNVITIDPGVLKRVEVISGPASLSHGSDALGGTIHFVTKDPEPGMNGNAWIRYGSSNNEYSAHADLNMGNGDWGSLTSVSYSNFGDLKSGKNRNPFLPKDDQYITLDQYVVREEGTDHVYSNPKDYLQKFSGYSQYDLLQKFAYRPQPGNTHVLNLQLSNSSDVPRYDRLTERKGDTPKFAEWYYGPQFRFLGSYQWKKSNWLGADHLALLVAYQRVKESRHNRKYNEAVRGNRFEAVDQITLNTDWTRSVNEHQFHAGIDGVMGFARSSAYGIDLNTGMHLPLDTRYADGGNQMHQMEGFVTHIWQWKEGWLLEDGIRLGYSGLKARFKNKHYFPFLSDEVIQRNLTYCASVALRYTPSTNWLFAGSLGSGFRVPNIDDLAKVFDSQAGRVVVPNPTVKPEKTITLDLKLSYRHEGGLHWEQVFYTTRYFDAITLAPATLNNCDSILYDGVLSRVYANKNNKSAFLWGSSSSLNWRFLEKWHIEGMLQYTYGQITKPTSMPLDHIPPLTGRIGFRYIHEKDRFAISGYSLFNGRKSRWRYNPDGEDNIGYATKNGGEGKGVPGWFTLNLKCYYRPHPSLKIQGGVENILDTRYRLFGSGINAAGRHFQLSLHTRF